MKMEYIIEFDGGEFSVGDCETTGMYGLAGAVVDVSKIVEEFKERCQPIHIDKIEIICRH